MTTHHDHAHDLDSRGVSEALGLARGTIRSAASRAQTGAAPVWFRPPHRMLNGGHVWSAAAVAEMKESLKEHSRA